MKLAVAAATVTALAAVPVSVDAGVVSAGPSSATFEGGTIDLAAGWGDAGACAEIDGAVDCYRTEAELLDAYPQLAASSTSSKLSSTFTTLSSCSSTLRLYTSTGYSGSVLYLTTRYLAINLSTYGFDNVTSSYGVGACSSAFYAGANLSGAQYPGSTTAYSTSSSMLTGWNNVVSSVIIF